MLFSATIAALRIFEPGTIIGTAACPIGIGVIPATIHPEIVVATALTAVSPIWFQGAGCPVQLSVRRTRGTGISFRRSDASDILEHPSRPHCCWKLCRHCESQAGFWACFMRCTKILHGLKSLGSGLFVGKCQLEQECAVPSGESEEPAMNGSTRTHLWRPVLLLTFGYFDFRVVALFLSAFFDYGEVGGLSAPCPLLCNF